MQQICSFDKFLDSQKNLLSPDAIATTKVSIINSLVAQIASVAIDADVATEINTAIVGCKFSDDEKGTLAAAVAKGFASDVQCIKASGKRTQTMDNPWNFLTSGDWVKLKNVKFTTTAKLITVVNRLVGLHMFHPSEATVKKLVAMVACVHVPDADCSVLHCMVLELKSLLIAARKDKAVTGPNVFPKDPRELSPATFLIAYPDGDDQPVQESLPNFAVTVARVPLRSTNKSAAFKPPGGDALCPAIPQGSPAMSGTDLVMQLLQRLVKPNFAAEPAITYFRRGSSSESNLMYVSQASPQPVDATPLLPEKEVQHPMSPTNATFATPDKPLLGESSGDPLAAKDALAMMELAAAKGGAGNVKGKGKPKTSSLMKRPAAADVVSFMKRPAGAPATGAPCKRPATSGVLMLGCKKCRGCHTGCAQCRDPSFSGTRYQR